MIFGSMEPLECYCAHVMLSEDEVYFTVLETKGSRSIYGPRPAVQVQLCFGLTSSLLTVGSPCLKLLIFMAPNVEMCFKKGYYV